MFSEHWRITRYNIYFIIVRLTEWGVPNGKIRTRKQTNITHGESMTKEKINIHQNKHYWQILVSKRKNKKSLYTITIYTLFLRVTLLNISNFMGGNGFLRLPNVSSFFSKLHNANWCIFFGEWLPSSYPTHMDVRWWVTEGVGWLWEVCSSRNKPVAQRLLMEINSGRPVHTLCQNTTCSSKFPSSYH